MNEYKQKLIIKIFNSKNISTVWDSEEEKYYLSIVDIIEILTDSANPRKYWSVLKNRLKKEGSEVTTKCSQLKMLAPDGKKRLRDASDIEGIFRIIESIPSRKAEPFKLWLAELGKERINETFNPELAINRAIEVYRQKGYDDIWIEKRLKGILDRKKLTDTWKSGGINQDREFAILTNEIYKEWSGMKASEYKELKGLRKESLRDNMTDIEVALTDLGEVATRELAKKYKPYGLEANKKVAKAGGHTAKVAKEDLEKNLGESVITSKNSLNYGYIKENLVDKSENEKELENK